MAQMGKFVKGQRGKALVIVLIIMVIGAMVMTGLLPFVTASVTGTRRESLNVRTHYAADAAVQRIITHAVLTSPSATPIGPTFPWTPWTWPPTYSLFDGNSTSHEVTIDYDGESYEATVDVYTTGNSTTYREYKIVSTVEEVISKVKEVVVIECDIKHWFGNGPTYQVDIDSWEIK